MSSPRGKVPSVYLHVNSSESGSRARHCKPRVTSLDVMALATESFVVSTTQGMSTGVVSTNTPSDTLLLRSLAWFSPSTTM